MSLDTKYIDVKIIKSMQTVRTSGLKVWVVLWKAFDALQDQAHRHIASLGLGLSDFAVLEVLLHKGPLPVNTIGGKVRLTSGSISVAVDRLEAKGLVIRKDDAADRRARIVHLTAAGRKHIRAAFIDHARFMETAVSMLSESERRQVVDLLKKLGRYSG